MTTNDKRAPQKLLWLDIETTGLRPEIDPMLEIAVVVTDHDLNVLDERSAILAPSINGRRLTAGMMEPLMGASVKAMHTKSGLLEKVESGADKAQVESEICDLVASHFGSRWAMLAGSSVHFDHSFLRVQMPVLDRLCHYRHFDVSVLQRAFEMWAPERRVDPGSTEAVHRALDDIRWSIHVAREYRLALKELTQ